MKKLVLIVVMVCSLLFGANFEEQLKFNSLAEKTAYKKQQEDKLKQQEQTLSKEEFYKSYDQLYVDNAKFLEKYAIKNMDSLESIDMKYQNREKLFQDKVKDIKLLKLKSMELQDYKYNKYRNNEEFKNRYPLSKSTKIEEAYLIYIIGFGSFFNDTTTLEKYESYLRKAYETYDQRQSKIAQKQKVYKEQNIQLEKRKRKCKKCLSRLVKRSL